MISHRLRLCFPLFGLFSILGAAGLAHGARVYEFIDRPELQNGYTLQGTITTTDDAPLDSVLNAGEVLGWEWSIVGVQEFSAASSDFEEESSVFAGVRITETVIELPLATADDPSSHELTLERFTDIGLGGQYSHLLSWWSGYDAALGELTAYNAQAVYGDAIDGFWFAQLDSPPGDAWTVATAVPEPATMVLLALGAIACVLWRVGDFSTRSARGRGAVIPIVARSKHWRFLCCLCACAFAIARPGNAEPALNTTTLAPQHLRAFSGVYPHLAVTNSHNEVGIGAMLVRDDALWFVTYGPHVVTGGSDELYRLNLSDLSLTTFHDYPGSTDANRYRDTRLGVDVLGAAYIDAQDMVRFLPVSAAGGLRGRITGTAAHLFDPQKLYYMTMEEGLYEVDFSRLDAPAIRVLREDGNVDTAPGIQKNLPGVHGKGLYTAQRRLLYTNNGADESAGGGLLEWNGRGAPERLGSWRIVDDGAQYTEVTSRRGPVDMKPNSDDPVWATGWDDASVFINVRSATSGAWTKFRLPKASYTHGHPNGWYTEWPRIRDVGLEEGFLFSHHGMMYLLPPGFSASEYSGVKPIATHHKMLVDYVRHGEQIIFGANDASRQLGNDILPKANSNLLFLDADELHEYGGSPSGFGGVWVKADVEAGKLSDPFLIGAFSERVVHVKHEGNDQMELVLEVDDAGRGEWKRYGEVTLPAATDGGYRYLVLPSSLDAQWLRVRAVTPAEKLTVYLHQSNEPREPDASLTGGLARVGQPRTGGVFRSRGGDDFEIEFAADTLDADGKVSKTGYYRAQLHPASLALELVVNEDPAAERELRSEAAPEPGRVGVDTRSAYIDEAGVRYRMPLGDLAMYSVADVRRLEREVVTERLLVNVGGSFYEVPKEFQGGGVRRMRPITTHNLAIADFMSWRGMLVLAGVGRGADESDHIVHSADGEAALWLGAVDDLWKFGPPRGAGYVWRDTLVEAGEASAPFLMTGYERKRLVLSHTSSHATQFAIEVDFLGTGEWSTLKDVLAPANEMLSYEFPAGYSAHWVRLRTQDASTVTARFEYE